MTLVRIVKNWDWPNLLRQLPSGGRIWGGIQFTLEPVDECDYLVVLNHPSETFKIRCPPKHVWAIMQEPAYEPFRLLHQGNSTYSRVYTPDTHLWGKRYIHSQPALPWHVNRDYDFLHHCDIPKKERDLSWITSNKDVFPGHRSRLKFLEKIQDNIEFELYGRGFRYIEDKWDGLAPYRYSLAVENLSNSYYWSEKLADCFLAWTMPIYYGCTQISRYFPRESMVCIDINDPQAIEKIKDTVASDRWYQNIDAIEHARQLVLDSYQLFPFVVQEIRRYEEACNCPQEPRAELITVSYQERPAALTIYERVGGLIGGHVLQRLKQLAAKADHRLRR
jgi:hypothetical protein